MSGLRFSPRWALSPRDWDIQRSWLEKSNTCPTRPEGTLQVEKQQQQHKHNEQQQNLRYDRKIFLLREVVLSYTGKRLFMGEQTLYSSIKPPEGLMYSGQLNQLSNFGEQFNQHMLEEQ